MLDMLPLLWRSASLYLFWQVAHTGELDATIEACSVVDTCVKVGKRSSLCASQSCKFALVSCQRPAEPCFIFAQYAAKFDKGREAMCKMLLCLFKFRGLDLSSQAFSDMILHAYISVTTVSTYCQNRYILIVGIWHCIAGKQVLTLSCVVLKDLKVDLKGGTTSECWGYPRWWHRKQLSWGCNNPKISW